MFNRGRRVRTAQQPAQSTVLCWVSTEAPQQMALAILMPGYAHASQSSPCAWYLGVGNLLAVTNLWQLLLSGDGPEVVGEHPCRGFEAIVVQWRCGFSQAAARPWRRAVTPCTTC